MLFASSFGLSQYFNEPELSLCAKSQGRVEVFCFLLLALSLFVSFSPFHFQCFPTVGFGVSLARPSLRAKEGTQAILQQHASSFSSWFRQEPPTLHAGNPR